MSRKKLLKIENLLHFNPITVGDRVNYIVANSELSGSKFCELIGISTGNLNGLINDDSKPGAKFNTLIIEHFRVNINWLLTGEGEKYIKEGAKGAAQLDEDPEIAELLEGARKVLKSGNQVAVDALERNIRYFSNAIDDQQQLSETKKQLKETKSRLDKMEDQICLLMERIQTGCRQKDEDRTEGNERRNLPDRRRRTAGE